MNKGQKIILGIVVIAILYVLFFREHMTQAQTIGLWSYAGIMIFALVAILGYLLYNRLTENSRMKAEIMKIYGK